VEEECNIKVKLGERITSTWHYYQTGQLRYLKQTKWFKMTTEDKSEGKPQKEEDIEEIKWMSEKEIKKAMDNTYPSIKHVIKKFQTKFPIEK
jgi:hypothetical protein